MVFIQADELNDLLSYKENIHFVSRIDITKFNISAGTVDYTDGDGVRLGNKRLSVKSEAAMPLI